MRFRPPRYNPYSIALIHAGSKPVCRCTRNFHLFFQNKKTQMTEKQVSGKLDLDKEDLKKFINRYITHYHDIYDVPRRKIFSSAAVSSEKVQELLNEHTPKLRIYLAKTDESCKYCNM